MLHHRYFLHLFKKIIFGQSIEFLNAFFKATLTSVGIQKQLVNFKDNKYNYLENFKEGWGVMKFLKH